MKWLSFLRKVTAVATLLAGSMLACAQPDRIYKSLDEVTDPAEVYNLRLRNKRLKTVPVEVYGMTNLHELDLRGNHISELSDSIILLQNLQRLELSRNPLMGLPAVMAQMESLRELVLWDTYVTDFPATFDRLDGTLELLDLRSCPLLPADQERIARMLPSVKRLWDKACNCGD